jgi:MFS family permease
LPNARRAARHNFTFICLHTVLPLWAVDPGPLEMKAQYYPILVGALAVGGLVATPVVPKLLERIGNDVALRLTPALLGLAIGTVAIRHVAAAIAGQFLCGVVIMMWNVVNSSYRQRTVGSEILGRVNGVYRWITWGVMPLAALSSGFISDWIGYQTLFLWSAGALVAVAVLTEPPKPPPSLAAAAQRAPEANAPVSELAAGEVREHQSDEPVKPVLSETKEG